MRLTISGKMWAVAAAAFFGIGTALSDIRAGVSPDFVGTDFMITLKEGVKTSDFEQHLSWVNEVHRRSARRDLSGVRKQFSIGDFKAYVGNFDTATIAELSRSNQVRAVEENTDVEVVVDIPHFIHRQENAPWGISALTSNDLPEYVDESTNQMGGQFWHHTEAGEDMWAYVIDSGVATDDPEFEGRAHLGFNSSPEGERHFDYVDHGTHVAGTIAAKTYGIAKKANIMSVKITRGKTGRATPEMIIAGIEWAYNNITNTPGRKEKSVMNMSITWFKTEALDAAVDAATAGGILSIVGAANDGANAGWRSPASAKTAFTVGAVDWNRTKAEWSNWGPDVDIFAPGVWVTSLSNVAGRPRVQSGTSMSTPHVSGAALYLKSLEDGLSTPDAVRARLVEMAQHGVVNDPKGSANVLLHLGGLFACPKRKV